MSLSSPQSSMPDFKDRQSLLESASVIASASCFLRIAQGEACSVNTRVKPTFQGKDAERLLKSFDAVFKYLKRAYDAFNAGASLLLEAEGSAGSYKGTTTGDNR